MSAVLYAGAKLIGWIIVICVSWIVGAKLFEMLERDGE